jgi:hypothetical protein
LPLPKSSKQNPLSKRMRREVILTFRN